MNPWIVIGWAVLVVLSLAVLFFLVTTLCAVLKSIRGSVRVSREMHKAPSTEPGEKIAFWKGSTLLGGLEVGFIIEVLEDRYVVRCKYSQREEIPKGRCFHIDLWGLCSFNSDNLAVLRGILHSRQKGRQS